MDEQMASLTASSKKSELCARTQNGFDRRARVAKAVTRLEAFLQAKLTDLERAAYREFLLTLDPDVMEEGVENVILSFRAERTRLPLPAEFLSFCPEIPKSRVQSIEAIHVRWRLELAMEDSEARDRAREEFRARLKAVMDKHSV